MIYSMDIFCRDLLLSSSVVYSGIHRATLGNIIADFLPWKFLKSIFFVNTSFPTSTFLIVATIEDIIYPYLIYGMRRYLRIRKDFPLRLSLSLTSGIICSIVERKFSIWRILSRCGCFYIRNIFTSEMNKFTFQPLFVHIMWNGLRMI